MKVDSIIPQPIPLPENGSSRPKTEKVSFGDLVNSSLENLNNSQKQADRAVKEFLTGKKENLHQVTIAMEEARLSMQLAVQVRNKLLEAYQEMMRMQV